MLSKKRLLHIWLTAGVLMVVLAACKRDLGNYDYNAINVITINTDTVNADRLMVINNDSLVIKQGDTLKVKVLLSQTRESDDVSFSWMITQKASTGGNPGQYVVGNEQQLKARIVLSPGVYNLVVKATDNKTGASYYKFYSLNVSTSPWGNEGWLVLQEQPDDNGCDLSVITSRDGVTRGAVYNNVYALANGRKLPLSTYKVNVMSYLNTTVGSQKVSFFYSGGGLQVRATDFSDSSTFDGWFSVAPFPDLQENGLVPGGAYEHLINNGTLYYRLVTGGTIKTPPILFGAQIMGTWSLAPYILHGSTTGEYYFTMYDQTYKSFLVYNASTGVLVNQATDVPNKHMANYSGVTDSLQDQYSGFDLNYIGRDLVYAENVTFLGAAAPTTHDCFFRNTNKDSTWLYQVPAYAAASNNNNSTGRFYLDPSKVPGINTATKFAVPTHIPNKDKFYYVGNVGADVIYTCTAQTVGRSAAVANDLNFPAGTAIEIVKVFKAGYTPVSPASPATESKVLVVATDETASNNGHKVYFFNIDASGNIIKTPTQVYTGFNKIVDIVFKKGLGL